MSVMMSKRQEVDFSFEWGAPFQGQSDRKWGNGGGGGVGGCSTVTAVSQAPLIKLANSQFAARLIDYIELMQ